MIKEVTLIRDLTDNKDFQKAWRINWRGMRLYVFTEPFRYYSGLTGALHAIQFRGEYNHVDDEWKPKMIDEIGRRGVKEFVQFTADSGTLLHEALLTIKETGGIDWGLERDKVEDSFKQQFIDKQMEPNWSIIDLMIKRHCNKVSSVLQFIYDRVEDIYGIETICRSDELKIATPIDLICKAKPIKSKTFHNCTLNLKSSDHVYTDHIQQVATELIMWNGTYQDYHCEYTGILRPKEGMGNTYELKTFDVGEALAFHEDRLEDFKLCLKRAKSTYYPQPTFKAYDGFTKAGEQPKIITRTLEEQWGEVWDKMQEK